MKKLLLFCLLFTSLFSKDISQVNKPPTVRVLLTSLTDDAIIEVKGRHILYNPKTNQEILTGSKSKRAKITTKEKGLYWGELFPGVYEIRFIPEEEKSSLLVNGIQYRGCVDVYSIGGTINIVNEIDVENYLKSILSPQLDYPLSKEALDAIAITERTNLFYLIQKDAYASWQIEGEKTGYMGEVAARKNRNVQEAVERTRDMILSFQKSPFPTSWGMNHAGKTVSYSSIYRRSGVVPAGVKYLPSQKDREQSKWKASIPLKTVASQFGMKNITGIDLFHAEKSSKIYGVRLFGESGSKDIDFFTFQRALGKKILKSNDFSVLLKGKKALFVGYGEGVGTGLCLLSAQLMAQGGNSSEKILTYHFPQTNLLNMRQETGRAPITSSIWR